MMYEVYNSKISLNKSKKENNCTVTNQGNCDTRIVEYTHKILEGKSGELINLVVNISKILK